jgi:hypothetical protein
MAFTDEQERVILNAIFNDATASNADLAKLADITATAAELSVLHGATLSTAELNILDNATLSTAELNILDNCTATYHDINAGSAVPHAPVFTMTKAAGAENVANFTYTVKDPGGTALTHCAWLMLWLSDSAAGEGVTSHAPDELAILSSKGVIISEFVSNSCALVQTTNAGELSFAITDTHKTLYKICLQSLRGEQICIDQIAVADYGAGG